MVLCGRGENGSEGSYLMMRSLGRSPFLDQKEHNYEPGRLS